MSESHAEGAEGSPNPSGFTSPIWYRSVAAPAARTAPDEDLGAEVCVVGAGIAGMSCAYLLARAGKTVVVIDEKPIGGGESGRTSAHLASALDDRFKNLESKLGLEATRLVYESHAAAIDRIEQIVRDEGIECGFARLDGVLFPGEGVARESLEKEFEAARRVGVRGVELSAEVPGGALRETDCVRFPHQARFQPLAYLRGVTDCLARMGARVYTGARVVDLSGDGPVTAKLASGRTITADFGVAATNVPSPINNWVGIYTKQAAYRTYVVGVEIPRGSVRDALYWDMMDPYHYVRLVDDGDRLVLLIGGEDHKTGQPGELDGEERFARLEKWARSWFPAASEGRVVCRWSGQVNEPDDGVAFIGRVPTRGHKGCFAITGDSGMGLTHGTLGAMLVSDLVLGRANPWEKVYDPSRGAWRAAGEFVKENVNAVAQLTDYLKPGEVRSAEEIRPGCGAVVRSGLSRLAVYRDPQGTVHTRSAVCPHLKCVVRWNDTEKSWDCPCHGSRFDASGRLVMGPAVDDLAEPK